MRLRLGRPKRALDGEATLEKHVSAAKKTALTRRAPSRRHKWQRLFALPGTDRRLSTLVLRWICPGVAEAATPIREPRPFRHVRTRLRFRVRNRQEGYMMFGCFKRHGFFISGCVTAAA